MHRFRMIVGALILTLAFSSTWVRADEANKSAGDRLAEAVGLYDEADYDGSRKVLLEIKKDDLTSEDDQLRLDAYLAKTSHAIAQVAQGAQDFAQATEAIKAGSMEEGKGLFEKVLDNSFAKADLKAQAKAQLEAMSPKLVEADAAPASASKPAGGSSLLDELSEEYALLWQQAIKTYRETENKIRAAVLRNDFDEARRLVDVAKQTIEINRRYASPASAYEDYRQQGIELQRFVEDEERRYDEELVIKKHEEIAAREYSRREAVRETQINQVNQLLDQAAELRKEQKYEEAVQVLTQVLILDPQNDQAAWMKETLGDLIMHRRDIEAVKSKHQQARDSFIENDETVIPWHDDIRYPKDWPSITARRTGAEEAAEPEVNRQVKTKLSKVAPELNFDAQPLEEVIETLRSLTGLNIIPNWTALETAGIEKDAEISLKLRNVNFEKALKLILEAAGGGETQLAYNIDEGVIQISTKEDLSRQTLTRVYNVQDLIISVPTFRGRNINIDNVGQNQQQGGLGGGRFLQGGGQGGGGQGGGQGGLFGGGGGGDELETEFEGDPLAPIIELIQNTIDPESWREAGGNVGSIQPLHQQLIVTQTSTAHQQLRDLLKQLRQSRALQIAVEARYITISRNWVEQIGIDLDVILNNGNAGFDRTTILDPATNNPILVPRQFSRLGFTPGAPGGVGINLPTQPFGQPYGQPGLVPGVGDVAPHSGQMTPIPLVNNTLDLAGPANTNINGSLGSLANQTPAFQVFGSFLDNIQVDFLLRATQIDRRSSDLDAPRLVLFNGQRATFEAFIEQDYIAALTPIIGDNAGAFLPQVATALTGRSLDVQATVSADRRYVTMTVRTFTRVTGDFRTVFFGGSQTVGSGFIELATQTTQQIRTTVSVPDGGTLLIGGLKLSGERDIDAGVPILSRIPILKRAFSNTSNVKDDQILLILIKPTIIIQEEAEAEAFPTLSSATNR